jgi:shikimate dehydrogenase
MVNTMKKQAIDSHTVFYGVFGDPIRQSRSPIMLNRAFQECGINAVYGAFHIKPGQVKDAIAGIRALGYGGVNVTAPHKLEVMDYIDEIDEGARVIGAVNTIVNRDGRLIGHNTDGIGYVRSLKEETGIQLQGARILLIGAGGAARGVGYALSLEQPETIWIANRTPERAVELAADLSVRADVRGMGMAEINHIKDKVDLIVNTTSIGMYPSVDESPADPEWFREGMVVSDLIYNPLTTRMLRDAQERGARIHGGLGMFIYQGAYAFEYWTGVPAPVEAMRETVEQSFYGQGEK